MPQLVGCHTHVSIWHQYLLRVKVHGSSKWTTITQPNAQSRPRGWIRSRKNIGVENHVSTSHTHRVVPERDGEVIAHPQAGMRNEDGARHGPHGETLRVQLNGGGESLPQNNVPPLLRQHVVRLACYCAAIVVNAQIPRRSAVPRRVVHVLRGHLDADRSPAIVPILAGGGVRLHGALSPARQLTHHCSRQPAVFLHHRVKPTAVLHGTISGNANTGATHHHHEPRQQQWQQQRGAAWLAHGLRTMCLFLRCGQQQCY
ncbi:unspecified product [Trypanosoma cruzi Dm28c]|uniref:Unspecified product n=1 Tax=Trypanosoma cruzi Dm28c TaxID=1416333 RepID=V5BQ99_TRYCR|nr:unspecified product [Trypanosoma cruzi Dm28c]